MSRWNTASKVQVSRNSRPLKSIDFLCLDRYGRGVTLQVKIGSPDDFIGSVQESVLTRDARGGAARHTGSLLGRSQSPPTHSSSPVPQVVVETTTNDGLAIQNFINFVENSFEYAMLVEQHLVNSLQIFTHTYQDLDCVHHTLIDISFTTDIMYMLP